MVVVSHDKYFTDKVTDHLFVFEGDGVVKDYTGSLSDYADCLIEIESSSGEQQQINTSATDEDKKSNYKDDKQARMQAMNQLKKDKKEMRNLDNKMEKLREEVTSLETKIEGTSQDEGWTVLAELTEKLNTVKADIDEKEMRWLELAEAIEEAEAM